MPGRYRGKQRNQYPLRGRESCTYCGELASQKDHVPSLLVRKLLPLNTEKAICFVVVPACLDCNNSLLKGDCSLTVLERRLVVHRALEKKLEVERNLADKEILKRRFRFSRVTLE